MTKPTLPYEQAAEHRTDITGWVCKSCLRYHGANEHTARWCCASDLPCAECGGRNTEKGYTVCRKCRDKREFDQYQNAKQADWDGETPLCTWHSDRYFFDADELADYIADLDGEDEGLPWLEICTQSKPRRFDLLDWANDDLAEDSELDDAGLAAEAAVNDWLAKLGPLWHGSGVRPTEKSVREVIGPITGE